MPPPAGQTLPPFHEDRPSLRVVSRALPVSVKKPASDGDCGPARSLKNSLADGNFELENSSGGLVTALRCILEHGDFKWYGCVDLEMSGKDQVKLREPLQVGYHAVPIFIDKKLADGHYNGFSNAVLWSLLHDRAIKFQHEEWEAYVEVNRQFARTIAEDIHEGDTIWVHDYHFMLVPKMLREQLPSSINVRIGFFFHTPFASSNPSLPLSVWEELLRGVLGSDMIGFHIDDYVRQFKSACSDVLGLATPPAGVLLGQRLIRLTAHPIGIDPTIFRNELEKPHVQDRMAKLKHKFRGKKVIIGVDRVDPIKGLPKKLLAFERFLEEHRLEIGPVVLVQVAVPSREGVREYQELKNDIVREVKRINERFHKQGFDPICLQYRSMELSELVAYYAISDVCLVTSTCDGMNLVSFEYIATQRDGRGVLCLSRTTGAARFLRGALTFGPDNVAEICSSIYTALTMAPEKSASKVEESYSHVRNHTSLSWSQSYLADLCGDPMPRYLRAILDRCE